MQDIPRQPPRAAQHLARVFRDSAGTTIVIMALSLSAMVGLAGLGAEVSSWYLTSRKMQDAASAAASTAAADLAANSSATSTQLNADAKSIAANLGFTDGSGGTTVTLYNPPASGTHSGDSSYVEVDISQPQTPLLAALFMSTGPTIAAKATAVANPSAADAGCVVALDQTAQKSIQTSGSGNMTFSGCALYDNSNASNAVYVGGSGSITAQAAYVVGGVSGSVTTTDGTKTGTNPTADPYGSVAQPTSNTTCNGWTGNGNSQLHLTSNSTATLYPSTAGGTCAIPQNIKMDSTSTLNLCPGVYVFNNGAGLLANGSSGVTINAPPTATTTPAMSSSLCPGDTTGGVTIVLASGSNGPGTIQINGQATVNLTAPTSGATKGIAVFQARTACTGNGNGNNGCGSYLQGGANQNITGAIYLPNNSITYGGGSSTGGAQCTQLIADTISFSGNSTFNSNCQSLGTSTIGPSNGKLVM